MRNQRSNHCSPNLLLTKEAKKRRTPHSPNGNTRRLSAWGVAMLLVISTLSTAGGEASGQERENPILNKGQQELQKQDAEGAVQEIDRLRRNMGSSVSGRLDGIPGLSKKDAESQFRNALQKLAIDRADQELSQGPTRVMPMPSNQIVRPHPSHPGDQAKTFRRDPQAITLRRVARQLEDMAAELEEAGLFDRADHLRHQAMEFWHQAR